MANAPRWSRRYFRSRMTLRRSPPVMTSFSWSQDVKPIGFVSSNSSVVRLTMTSVPSAWTTYGTMSTWQSFA